MDYFIFFNIMKFCDRNIIYNLSITSKDFNHITTQFFIYELKIDFNKIFSKCINKQRKESIEKLLRENLVDLSVLKKKYHLGKLFYYDIDFKIISILYKYNFFDQHYNKTMLETLVYRNEFKKVNFMLKTFKFSKDDLDKVMFRNCIQGKNNQRMNILLATYRFRLTSFVKKI